MLSSAERYFSALRDGVLLICTLPICLVIEDFWLVFAAQCVDSCCLTGSYFHWRPNCVDRRGEIFSSIILFLTVQVFIFSWLPPILSLLLPTCSCFSAVRLHLSGGTSDFAQLTHSAPHNEQTFRSQTCLCWVLNWQWSSSFIRSFYHSSFFCIWPKNFIHCHSQRNNFKGTVHQK